MQRAKRLSITTKKKSPKKRITAEHKLGEMCIRQIIISHAFKLGFFIEERVLTFSETVHIKQRYCEPLISSARKREIGKWLRGHGGHLNCFTPKQTRHVIKIPQDALIKLAKLIQIIFTHLSDFCSPLKTSIRLLKAKCWREGGWVVWWGRGGGLGRQAEWSSAWESIL